MNRNTLIGLAVAALIAIVIAVVLNRTSQPRSESGGEEANYLVPALRDHVNDVDKVLVSGAENKPVATLTRKADGWSIAEKGGYAADTGKLREFLLKLADTKLIEQKTANKDKYATLGVEDVDGKDAKSMQIDLGGLGAPVKLIVGNSNAHGGTFVRRAGEAQSWLASGSITVDKKAENWLRKDLVDIPVARIAAVEITHADGKAIRVSKQVEGDQNFKVADVPKGREAGSEFTVNGLASTLGGLRFDDVIPSKDAPPSDKPLKAHFATFDGLIVDAVAWEKDGKDYAQFTASVDADRAGQHIAAQQAKAKADYDAQGGASQKTAAASVDTSAKAADANASTPAELPKPAAVSDPANDREQKLAAINKEANDLNAGLKDWTYVLPAYKFANLNKSPDDLLKPLDEKKDEKKPAATKKPAVSPVKKAG
ncbi:MAG TPA: DUF4340 domain-containing protein [Rhodanobacteraceae bacterium]|jgi:hypothetical protein|nr:DUF4340 domain-containing protein [Rhodanobacteraceae bacterium]